jgi:hypothetical protein
MYVKANEEVPFPSTVPPTLGSENNEDITSCVLSIYNNKTKHGNELKCSSQ